MMGKRFTLCLASISFGIVVIPMFAMWVKDMFIHWDNIKWIAIVGGYLSKEKTSSCW